ncbi:MAG: glucose 1-dehydrogenase [Candidatus Methylacidiphilales bacterium]|nr:glucose 1-dehydrogenase [Candidatus Methylacidiphilales bacterium]
MAIQSGSGLDGKVVVVTGGSSGIGKACALALSRQGATVTVVADLNLEGLQQTVAEMSGQGFYAQLDISQPVQVKDFFRSVVEKYGRIDCAINNAGIEGQLAPTAACSEENWDRVLSVNLKGTWLCMREQINQMLKQGAGSIVNISSVLGLVALPGYPAYAASKHGIVGLTKAAALEYAQAGIRVNALCPGAVQTPLMDRMIRDNPGLITEELFVQQEPIGRVARPEEIAAAAVWLCSDAASFVTGVALPVDGGVVAR